MATTAGDTDKRMGDGKREKGILACGEITAPDGRTPWGWRRGRRSAWRGGGRPDEGLKV
jgi:hypothetical protein